MSLIERVLKKVPINIDGKFSRCSIGCELSVNYSELKQMTLNNVEATLSASKGTQMRVLEIPGGAGGSVSYNGSGRTVEYDLVDIYMTMPSRFRLKGAQYVGEIGLVHQSSQNDGDYLVLLVFGNISDASSAAKTLPYQLLKKISTQLPSAADSTATVQGLVSWSADDILPTERSFYTFKIGNVEYIVFDTTIDIPTSFQRSFVGQITSTADYSRGLSLKPRSAGDMVISYNSGAGAALGAASEKVSGDISALEEKVSLPKKKSKWWIAIIVFVGLGLLVGVGIFLFGRFGGGMAASLSAAAAATQGMGLAGATGRDPQFRPEPATGTETGTATGTGTGTETELSGVPAGPPATTQQAVGVRLPTGQTSPTSVAEPAAPPAAPQKSPEQLQREAQQAELQKRTKNLLNKVLALPQQTGKPYQPQETASVDLGPIGPEGTQTA